MTDHIDRDMSPLQEKLDILWRMVQEAVVTIDAETLHVVEANPAACSLFGIREKHFVSKPSALLFNDLAALKKVIRRSGGFLGGTECIKGDGRVFRADLGISYMSTKPHSQAMIVFWHIVDAEQAEKDRQWRETLVLERIHTESAFFLGEEYERKRLARELHGHLGPMMFAVKLGLEQLLARGKSYISRKQLKNILAQHTDAIKESRIMTSRLSEAFLPEDDINAAIHSLVQRYDDPGLLSIYCKADRLPGDLSSGFRYHLMQIIEESLTNVIKHAAASRVSIRLSAGKKDVELYVLDNGQGASGRFFKPGRGLHIMQQRAALMGGNMRIETTENRYFKVFFTAPLYEPNDK